MKAALSVLFVLSLSWVGSFPALSQTPTPTRSADLDGNGRIDSNDLILFLRSWQQEAESATPTPTSTDTPGNTDTETPAATETPSNTQTATDTPSFTPTETPTGEVIEIPLPNLAVGARPLRLVRIPAGTFQMGSPNTERGRYSDWEGPVHTVTLTHDFYMGETEVTQAQWQAVMGSNPAYDYGVGNDYPVYYVSWDDCQAFITSLNTQGQGTFRLPTEAEWEYACRAGTSTRFSFGDNLLCDDGCGACALASQYMVWCGNDQVRSEPVGPPRLPNAFGLYEMHGNVWEWCQDWFQSDFYSQPGATALDPLCTNATSGYRVICGGYWDGGAGSCRSAMRGGYNPTGRYFTIGVRVVLVP